MFMFVVLSLIIATLMKSVDSFSIANGARDQSTVVPNNQAAAMTSASESLQYMNSSLTRLDQFHGQWKEHSSSDNTAEQSGPHSALLDSTYRDQEEPFTLANVIKRYESANKYGSAISGLQMGLANNLCKQVGPMLDQAALENMNQTFSRINNGSLSHTQFALGAHKSEKPVAPFNASTQMIFTIGMLNGDHSSTKPFDLT